MLNLAGFKVILAMALVSSVAGFHMTMSRHAGRGLFAVADGPKAKAADPKDSLGSAAPKSEQKPEVTKAAATAIGVVNETMAKVAGKDAEAKNLTASEKVEVAMKDVIGHADLQNVNGSIGIEATLKTSVEAAENFISNASQLVEELEQASADFQEANVQAAAAKAVKSEAEKKLIVVINKTMALSNANASELMSEAKPDSSGTSPLVKRTEAAVEAAKEGAELADEVAAADLISEAKVLKSLKAQAEEFAVAKEIVSDLEATMTSAAESIKAASQQVNKTHEEVNLTRVPAPINPAAVKAAAKVANNSDQRDVVQDAVQAAGKVFGEALGENASNYSAEAVAAAANMSNAIGNAMGSAIDTVKNVFGANPQEDIRTEENVKVVPTTTDAWSSSVDAAKDVFDAKLMNKTKKVVGGMFDNALDAMAGAFSMGRETQTTTSTTISSAAPSKENETDKNVPFSAEVTGLITLGMLLCAVLCCTSMF
eukprot:TRINITY_DN11136_c0_g1_i1.p1 TRINITY_DN11136_c0_g1~~TRINITY_DN11136_c0_g1_i1.p1  ORF type:complete len:484 (-),score=134.01 TRINITY_DN11136_c0_g1_i1:186-1637(-)